ncbi:endonuclease VII domain-containing protein [Sphaerisporangium melleum]|nr:endonuclease VII domain-containing protein [Sphaerisporangium melleum]
MANRRRRGKSDAALPTAVQLPKCAVEECTKRAKNGTARWCNAHYIRWYKYGDPLLTGHTAPKSDGTCRHCQGKTPGGRKYCSTICENRSRSGKEDVARFCRVCDVEIPADSHLRRVFCSKACKRMDGRARMYGLTAKDYYAMYTAQAGRCAACGDATDSLFIDHCHASGRVRGLLCTLCNTGIGMFKEDPDRLRGAIAYLSGGAKSAKRAVAGARSPKHAPTQLGGSSHRRPNARQLRLL